MSFHGAIIRAAKEYSRDAAGQILSCCNLSEPCARQRCPPSLPFLHAVGTVPLCMAASSMNYTSAKARLRSISFHSWNWIKISFRWTQSTNTSENKPMTYISRFINVFAWCTLVIQKETKFYTDLSSAFFTE